MGIGEEVELHFTQMEELDVDEADAEFVLFPRRASWVEFTPTAPDTLGGSSVGVIQ